MDLLKDDNLIDILANSKLVSAKIEEENKISAEAEKIIDQTREDFRVVAFRSSILYFCITDLDKIDPMYQYSLQWFARLFANGVKNSIPDDDRNTRIKNINNYFTLSLY